MGSSFYCTEISRLCCCCNIGEQDGAYNEQLLSRTNNNRYSTFNETNQLTWLESSEDELSSIDSNVAATNSQISDSTPPPLLFQSSPPQNEEFSKDEYLPTVADRRPTQRNVKLPVVFNLINVNRT